MEIWKILINPQRARKFKKVQPKKTSGNQINQFHEKNFSIFCNFKYGQKSIFGLGKSLKLAKMQFHEENFLIYLISRVFFALTFLIFLARCEMQNSISSMMTQSGIHTFKNYRWLNYCLQLFWLTKILLKHKKIYVFVFRWTVVPFKLGVVILSSCPKVGIIYYFIAARCLYHSHVNIFWSFYKSMWK